MRITFSQDLVVANAQTAANILAAFDALTPERDHALEQGTVLRPFHGCAHALSFDADSKHYTYVIDDEMLVRIFNLYVKVAFIVAPVVHSVITVLKRLKGEVAPQIDEINDAFAHVQYIDELVEAGAGDADLEPCTPETWARHCAQAN